MQDKASLYEFVRIGEVAETTTQLLALNLQHRTTLGGRSSSARSQSDNQVEHYVLQQARDYLGQVREGFMLSVRQNEVPTQGELRYLLERILFDWAKLSEELNLEVSQTRVDTPEPPHDDAGRGLSSVRYQLLAFGMAATALGFLPRTPAEEITFPYSFSRPPNYGDIPAPATPAEMLHRIEELVHMTWKLMSVDLQELVNHHYGPLRRTYGFFEVSALLARQETKRIGIKKRRSQLRLWS
ncbi:MAG: hypothetical protein H3C34_25170 [Caldilineaceae bacterium]|nr:hypothetical protein [Caldilineaceae bacterium]